MDRIGFTIGRKELAATLATLGKISKGIPAISFGDMSVKVDDGQLSITALNRKTCLTRRIGGLGTEGSGSFVIDSVPLLSLVKKAGDKEVSVSVEDGRNMTVACGETTMTLPIGNQDVFPRIFGAPDGEPMELDMDALSGPLGSAARFTLSDTDMPALDNVKIETRGGVVTIYSTDRNSLYRYRVPEITAWPDGDIFMSSDMASSLTEKMGKGKALMWSLDRMTFLHTADADMYEIPYEGNYYDCSIFERDPEPDVRVKVDPKELAGALSRCSVSEMYSVEMSVEGDTISLMAFNELTGVRIRDKVRTISRTGEDVSFVMGISQLDRAIGVMPKGNVTISRWSARHYVRIAPDGDGGEWVMAMESIRPTSMAERKIKR